MILIIDNYDSFTYNLSQMISCEKLIVRNDKITIEEIKRLDPQAILLSPGPGTPADAGICVELIRQLSPHIPILGVCLGHQAIAEAFGGKVIGSPKIMHGKPSLIFHRRQGMFKNVPLPFTAGRYHSLTVERDSLPSSLIIEAETESGEIMALRHEKYPCYGVQFHPESILTPEGERLIQQFLTQVKPCH